MAKKIDLTGREFGRWTVLKEEEPRSRSRMWLCICKCGNIKIIQGSSLKCGGSKSCGCIIKEAGTSLGMWGKPTYISWEGMIQRCNNPDDKSYKNYGGRGIKVCKRWLKFENFYVDMGSRPEGLTIERTDNNKGYFPENCKWATQIEQQRNKRPQKRSRTGFNGIIIDGKISKYKVSIMADYKTYNLGTFPLLADAIEARKQGEEKYWNKERADPAINKEGVTEE